MTALEEWLTAAGAANMSTSVKGGELQQQPRAAMCMYWDELEKQVHHLGPLTHFALTFTPLEGMLESQKVHMSPWEGEAWRAAAAQQLAEITAHSCRIPIWPQKQQCSMSCGGSQQRDDAL